VKLYEKVEDLRIYAIVEVNKRGKMGIVMTGSSRKGLKPALGRMMIGPRRTTFEIVEFAPVELILEAAL
jgi:hypothetical protein